jgi:hypothetical protein
MHLAAHDYGNPQVAAILEISRRSAEAHRANLMHKLGLRCQTDLVRHAIERGIAATEARMIRRPILRPRQGRPSHERAAGGVIVDDDPATCRTLCGDWGQDLPTPVTSSR